MICTSPVWRKIQSLSTIGFVSLAGRALLTLNGPEDFSQKSNEDFVSSPRIAKVTNDGHTSLLLI